MSSAASGDFTPSDLLHIQTRAEEIFANDLNNPDYVGYVDAAKVILARQTAEFSDLTDPDKDRSVDVIWLADCDDEEPEDCDDDCNLAGPEIGSLKQTYALDICFQKKFTVREKLYRSNAFNGPEVVAKALLRKMKLMDEEWTRRLVGAIDGHKGTNNAPEEFDFDALGSDTYIPATSWTPDLFGYLSLAAIKNKLVNSILLSGSNLYRQQWRAEMESGNADGKGADAKFKAMPIEFDLFNIDAVVGRKTFLINPNVMAFVTKTYYPSTPVSYNGDNIGQLRSSVPSMNLPGVSYDWFTTLRCVGNEIYRDFMIQTNGGILFSPYPCDSNRTGILSFVCGVNPN